MPKASHRHGLFAALQDVLGPDGWAEYMRIFKEQGASVKSVEDVAMVNHALSMSRHKAVAAWGRYMKSVVPITDAIFEDPEPDSSLLGVIAAGLIVNAAILQMHPQMRGKSLAAALNLIVTIGTEGTGLKVAIQDKEAANAS